MDRLGILVICLAILAAGLFYVNQGTQDATATHSGDKNSKNDSKHSTWLVFKPRSGLFQVALPHSPQYAKDFVPIPGTDQKRRYDMYASEDIDGTVFLISVITYPAEAVTGESSELLKQIVNELMKAKPDNQLISQKESSFQGHEALDFKFENKQFHVEGKAFKVDNRVYVLSHVTRKGDREIEDFNYFINSFELLNPTVETNKESQ